MSTDKFLAYIASPLYEEIFKDTLLSLTNWKTGKGISNIDHVVIPQTFISSDSSCLVFDITADSGNTHNQELYSDWSTFFDGIKNIVTGYVGHVVSETFYKAKKTELAQANTINNKLSAYITQTFKNMGEDYYDIHRNDEVNNELEKVYIRLLKRMAQQQFTEIYAKGQNSFINEVTKIILDWGIGQTEEPKHTTEEILSQTEKSIPANVKNAFKAINEEKVYLRFCCMPLFLCNTELTSTKTAVKIYLYHKVEVVRGEQHLNIVPASYQPLDIINLPDKSEQVVINLDSGAVVTSVTTPDIDKPTTEQEAQGQQTQQSTGLANRSPNPFDVPYLGCFASINKPSAGEISANIMGYINHEERQVIKKFKKPSRRRARGQRRDAAGATQNGWYIPPDNLVKSNNWGQIADLNIQDWRSDANETEAGEFIQAYEENFRFDREVGIYIGEYDSSSHKIANNFVNFNSSNLQEETEASYIYIFYEFSDRQKYGWIKDIEGQLRYFVVWLFEDNWTINIGWIEPNATNNWFTRKYPQYFLKGREITVFTVAFRFVYQNILRDQTGNAYRIEVPQEIGRAYTKRLFEDSFKEIQLPYDGELHHVTLQF